MDTFDTFDVEKFQILLTALKDSGAAYFRFGELEVGWQAQEKATEEVAGFVPRKQQAVVKASEGSETKYDAYAKVFGGELPSFKKVNG